jgi:hypothetical protein
MALHAPVVVHATDLNEKDVYRLIVFDRTGTLALIAGANSECHLPRIEISRFTRLAQEVTGLLRNVWHAPSVFLFSGALGEGSELLKFAALELQSEDPRLPDDLRWFTVNEAIAHLLRVEERETLKSAYHKAVKKNEGKGPEPFSRIGWMGNLQEWVETVIRPLGMELKDFLQLNGCETFSLIRFDTTGLPVWFKAVGEPNLHEFSISVTLSRLFPEYLPSLLAVHPPCHGWLMADAGGPLFNEAEEPFAWKHAATALAGLQIASIGAINGLLEAGCRDLRPRTLLELVDSFVEVIGDLMQQQTKVPPAILSRQELCELGATLKNALRCLESLGTPDTLGHSDFNPGNILVGPDRCVFIDWAEAHVSHPFLTFEYLISHLRKDYPTLTRFEDAIRSSYAQSWQSVSLSERVSEAFLFSPLVAVFAYAVAGNSWRDPERLKIPYMRGYLRSLARRMKREAESVPRRRVTCVSY